MRIINFFRNSMYSLLSFFFLSLMGVYIRKLFTENLSVELLGLEGLFSSIVSILSLAELGIASVINYSLYKALANDDKEEVNILMNIYRYMYRLIGSFIFIISVVLYYFLPFIISERNIPWYYVELVYFVQIATVVSTYFIAYKRTLFAADQKDYISIKIDTICRMVANCVRIIAIVCFQSYLLYALIALFFNILANLIITFKVNKTYTFIKPVKVSVNDMRNRNFFKDIKNFMVHKLAYIFYGGADSILVTTFLGLNTAGLMANYLLVHTGIYTIMYKCFQGIVPTLGNLVYSESKEKSFKVYKILDLLYTFLGAYICCIYILFFQKFFMLFFGKEFLLDDNYALLLGIQVFLAMQFENACNYRNTYGSFEKDRIYMIFSAISKIVIAILLMKELGIAGLILGTIVGLFFIIYGRIVIVFKCILKQRISVYLIKHLIYSCIVIVEILLIKQVISIINLPLNYYSLVLELLLATVMLIIINIIVFYKTEEFIELLQYFNSYINVAKQQIKNKQFKI